MEEYKSNSHKSREGQAGNIPAKKVEKVVTGEVTTRKRSGIQKVADALISEDVSDVRSYILTDLVMPIVRRALSDIVANSVDAIKDSVDTILLGETRRNRRNSNALRVSYRGYYDNRGNDRRDSLKRNQTRGSYSYDDVILASRGEAEEVLSRMEELIATYGLVSVADLYDLVGVLGNHTDNKYGWTDIHSAEAIRVRDGYMLKLPRAVPLD